MDSEKLPLLRQQAEDADSMIVMPWWLAAIMAAGFIFAIVELVLGRP